VTTAPMTLGGADAGNYTLTQPTLSGNITAKGLTVTGAAVSAKVYDGNAVAAITGATLSGVVGTEAVTLANATTGAFDNKNVGLGKPVATAPMTLAGADAGNYTLTQPTLSGDIRARALVVSAAGVNKGYDGTSSATVTLSDNRVSGDVLSTSYTAASFADKVVGVGKTVSVSGIAISGADAGNYSANTIASTTADITARALVVSAAGVNKEYDGTTSATVTLSDNRVSGDVLSASYTTASFADKAVGVGKAVSVSGIAIRGADAGNYSVNTTASTTAYIRARLLVVSAAGVNKGYDGTSSATVTLSDNRVSGDVLSASYTAASFADKAVGAGKAVSVSGIAISGADAGNYSVKTTASTTANITAKGLTVTGAAVSAKVYNGTTVAAITGATLSGVVGTEEVSLANATTGTFDNKNVGIGKPVVTAPMTLVGADAGNYTLTQPTLSGDITPAALIVTADDKSRTYGAGNPTLTGTLSGIQNGDNITASFSTTADTNSPVGGYDIVTALHDPDSELTNYTVTINNGTLTITPATLTVTAADAARAYGEADPAFTATIGGFVNGQNASVVSGTPSLTTTATATSRAGIYPIISALGTLSASNYTFNFVNGTLTISEANSDTVLTSSHNPSLYASSVTFTATVTPVSPAVTTPTGSVQFYTNGVAYDGPVLLSAGQVSLSLPLMPLGSNIVSAAYLGDNSFLGSIATLVQVVRPVPDTPSTLGIQRSGSSTVTVTFSGTPDAEYVVQASGDLGSPGAWTNVSTNIAGTDGHWTITDSTADHPVLFYRAVVP
jgi:hypothetical protein